MAWNEHQLLQLDESGGLHVAPFREDGKTYGTPTWIWSVELGGDVFVRAFYGRQSRWYQAAIRERAGRVIVAGHAVEVSFSPEDGPLNDYIDDAYIVKYRGSPYLEAMTSARARGATVKVTPRLERPLG
jgi:hypothetical protein